MARLNCSTRKRLPSRLLILILAALWLPPAAEAATRQPHPGEIVPHAAAPRSRSDAFYPDGGYWAAGFAVPGVSDKVSALAAGEDGSLVAVGSFTIAGRKIANRTTRLDGATRSVHPGRRHAIVGHRQMDRRLQVQGATSQAETRHAGPPAFGGVPDNLDDVSWATGFLLPDLRGLAQNGVSDIRLDGAGLRCTSPATSPQPLRPLISHRQIGELP